MIDNKRNETIYLQSAKMSGVKGIGDTLHLNFTPSKSREFMDNVEFWGLERSKYEFGALKTIMLIGENGTGKSSVLESMFLLGLFMNNPRHIMDHKRLNPLQFYEEKGYAKWEAEYVTKSNEDIIKYFVEVELSGNNVKRERLSFITTRDGKTISDKKCIYDVKDSMLIQVFEIDLNVPERLQGSNGWNFIQRRGSQFSNLFDTPEAYNNNFAMHAHFFRDAFKASINRHYSTGKDLTAVPLRNIKDEKVKKIIGALYKLFDKSILDVEIDMRGEAIIEYMLGRKKTMLNFDSYLSMASTGNVRAFDLINTVLKAITTQGAIYIDEPERSMHQTLSAFIVGQINAFAKGQVFYATHNLELTEQAIRTDQITLLCKDKEDKITSINGYEISPSKNSKFISLYMNQENLSEPNLETRVLIDELMEDYAG